MAADEKLGRAVLELVTTDKGFERGIKTAENRATALARKLDSIGKAAQQVGKSLTLYVTTPIIGLGIAAIRTASDVQEMQNLFRETFESSSDDVEAWAAEVAKSMGRSRFELMRTAADFAAFLKPLGVADDAIAPMSQALTELTTDISSFRNMAEEDVFTRLFSGLAGETEAVRRLGIDIGQAALEQELLNQGITDGAQSATQAQKVMARFALILRQTTDAQGDATRTAGSFENQQRALMATIKDIGVEIGQRFLPLATRMVAKLRELGQRFLELPQHIQSGIVAVLGFVAVVGPAIVALGLMTRAVGFAIGGFAAIAPALLFVGKAIRTALIAIQAVVIGFLGFFATIPGAIITSLTAIVGGFFIFKDTVIGFFKGLVLAIKDAFIAGFNNNVVIPFQNAINSLADQLKNTLIFSKIIKPISVNDVIENSFSGDMKQVIADAVESGKADFKSFQSAASAAIDGVKTKFAELKGAAAAMIPDLELADFTLENMGRKFDELLANYNDMIKAMGTAGDAATAAGDRGVTSFQKFGEAIRSNVEDNLTQALSSVRSFGDAARSILNAVIEAIIRTQIVQPFLGFLGIPGFADGGRPPTGRPSIVGERGPEVFVPDSAGTIIPNDKLGGMGGGIVQNNNFPMVFPTQLEAFIRNIAASAGRETAVATFNGIRGRI